MRSKIKRETTTIKRAKPKKGFARFFKSKIKTFNAHVNEFEDDTANSKVVRLLVVVLLLHLIFIGGVSLHGVLVDKRKASLTDSPAVAVVPTVQQVAAPLADEGADVVSNAVITNTSDLVPAPVVVEEGTPPAPELFEGNAVSDAKPGTARHLYATGDSWESIARDNDCSVGDLKAVNPGVKLASGITLVIPVLPGAGDDNVPLAEPDSVHDGGVLYVIKKGDTLSKVARQYKVSVSKLQSHNNITDPRKIKIGQEIRIPSE